MDGGFKVLYKVKDKNVKVKMGIKHRKTYKMD